MISVQRSGYSKTITAWTDVAAEVRLYDRLLVEAHPGTGGKDFIENLNPNSLKVLNAIAEPSFTATKADNMFHV